MMCEAFPNDPEWMEWYAAVALYCEYQKQPARATEPYASYRLTSTTKTNGGNRRRATATVPAAKCIGAKCSTEWRWAATTTSRPFPSGSPAAATTACCSPRQRDWPRSPGCVATQCGELALAELQWVVGRNPFAQSTMWGEGYDFEPQYSVSVGDIVGALPVGMMTRDNGDLPYWPASNTYVFKEVWVHPSARGSRSWRNVLARPRPEPFPFTVTERAAPGGGIEIAVEASGQGRHSFSVRSDNLTVEGGPREFELRPGVPGRLTWKARVKSADAPWFAVVIADGDVSHRREISGVGQDSILRGGL